ncbi:MAG TPA: phage/plasmid primase, P4 family, partial [Aquabacterium sp.]|nr:phage/plasmid primase, P4 family [Aquabacterium sp.]
EQHPVTCLQDLYNLLREIEHDPRKCIIRGKPRAEVDLSGPVARRLTNFEDKPSRLFMIDSDRFAPVMCDEPWKADQIELALNEYLALLPEEFRNASFIWQASGSFGHPSKGNTLRGHLWFWLDTPISCADAETLTKLVLPGLADNTVHRTVQANYTARPLMSGADPVSEHARLLLVEHWFSSELTLPEPTQSQRSAMEAAKSGRKSRKDLVDPRDKPGVLGAFSRLYSPEDIIDLCPEHFTNGRSPDRITWLQGGGSAEGIGVSDSGTHLFNTHDSSPCGDRALNLYDFIRVHVFGHLDDASMDYSLDMANAPSEIAMREWALQQPGVAEEVEATRERTKEVRDAEREQERANAYAQWQEELKACEDTGAIEGRMIGKLAELRLTVFEEERAKKLVKDKMQTLGFPITDKLLNSALKDAHKRRVEQQTQAMVDIEIALAKQVLTDHFGGPDGPWLKRFGGGWWRYTDGLWRPTEQDLVENRVSKTVVRVKEKGDAKVKDLAMFMAEAGRSEYLTSMVNAVTTQLRRMCGESDVQSDPLDLMGRRKGSVINCRNGELWFDDDGEVSFLEHDPEHLLTSQIACDYEPDATCPLFEAALRRVFSRCAEPDEMIRHWLELMGTIIQPKRIEAFWVLLKGPGGNGKSFLTEIVESLMGQGSCYKGSIAEIEKGANTHFTSSLVGKLMFFDDDVKKGVPLPDDWIKKLSEEKVLTANPKNKDTFEFVNRAIAVMLANHWPHTTDMSHGMLRRAHVIEMNYIIPASEIRVGEKDRILGSELPGVLNLLVQGWQRVLRRGGFARPAEVVQSIERWKEKANMTARFIGTVLKKSDKVGVRVSVAQVYDCYRSWILQTEGAAAKPIGRRSFDEALEAAGIEVEMHHNQQSIKGYYLASLGAYDAGLED